ncbi:STAS domain-containing protein [Amycolatopsis sp. lyj-109]|uniref:STAS domain-containing protein n=1 Tax=Amycolatopsis sp. lyj-109 TaxID=2789287 RepID=UPI0039797131
MTHRQNTLPAKSPAVDAPAAFRLTIHRPAPDTGVVEVVGDLEVATAPRLRELIATEVEGPLSHLVLDLRGVRFLSATGLAAIEYGHRLATGRGIVCTVRVAAAGRALRVIQLLPVGFADAIELA